MSIAQRNNYCNLGRDGTDVVLIYLSFFYIYRFHNILLQNCISSSVVLSKSIRPWDTIFTHRLQTAFFPLDFETVCSGVVYVNAKQRRGAIKNGSVDLKV